MSRPCRLVFIASVLCLLSGLPVATHAVLAPSAGTAELPAGLDMDVFEDDTAMLDVEAVASPLYADRFRPIDRARPNFGFRRSALWFRLQLDLRDAADQQWHLVESHPLLDELTFFLPDGDGGWEAFAMGDTRPFVERPRALREFVLPLPPDLMARGDSPVTVYIRIAGKGALNVDLRLASAQGLAESAAAQYWGYGLFYGALLVMFAYNLFLYLATRESTQLHYIVFLGGFGLLFFSLNGFGLQFLWPEVPAINGWFPVFTCIAVWGGLQFTRSFLDIRRDNPRIDAAFSGMTHAVIVIFLLGLLLPRHLAYLLGTILPLFFALLMLAAGVLRMRQGYAPARLFVAAWGLLLAGAVLYSLANLGALPIHPFTQYSPQIGAVLQVLLLSVAIGERMKLLKQENERIQLQAHAELAGMFDRLKALDADKMRFLNYLSHELNTPLNWMSALRHADTASSQDVREALLLAEAGQQRMMDLVATVMRYFDLAGEDPARIAVAPLAPMWLVDELLHERSAEIAARGLKVANRVPADLVVQTSEPRLRRILGHLIDNAMHFSADGSELVIEGLVGAGAASAAIAVRDSGRGIDGTQLAGLFEPFFMVGSHHREGGFGLSLAMSRLLAVNMGGDLRAHSAGRGTGATFTVTLPTGASAADRPGQVQTPAG